MPQVMNSSYTPLGSIVLPMWQGSQKYMHIFDPANPVMADGFEDYLDVATQLCKDGGVRTLAHMTVDEKIVQPGMSQRRPKAHVDGYFMQEPQIWGHPAPQPGAWAHYCNQLPVSRMAIIVAASVPGCTAYEGTFYGDPMPDGDMEHIRGQLPTGVLLPANQGFLLSPDCVHESMVFNEPTQRTFLRIAFAPQ